MCRVCLTQVQNFSLYGSHGQKKTRFIHPSHPLEKWPMTLWGAEATVTGWSNPWNKWKMQFIKFDQKSLIYTNSYYKQHSLLLDLFKFTDMENWASFKCTTLQRKQPDSLLKSYALCRMNQDELPGSQVLVTRRWVRIARSWTGVARICNEGQKSCCGLKKLK